MFRLDHKHAVITGGASGIGLAIARTFHAQGAAVTILDLNPAAGLAAAQTISADAAFQACDVSDPENVAQAFAAIHARGPVHILVNSAGISHVGTLLNTTPEDFDRLYRVNVNGTFLCMQAAIARMQESGGGVIVNMSSIAATSGLADRFAYSATKGAVLAMTFSVARDYIQSGIRVNAISPARVHTPFVDGFVAKNYPGRETEMLQKLASSQPIGRMGTPEEISWLALYLCSDEASFITGADYPIDGGYLNIR